MPETITMPTWAFILFIALMLYIIFRDDSPKKEKKARMPRINVRPVADKEQFFEEQKVRELVQESQYN
jgi:hypothetical protein